MIEKGINENCIQQIYRLFARMVYGGAAVPVDKEGRIRIDDLEMRPDVQEEVIRRWAKITDENLAQYADLQGYHEEFLRLFGFGFPTVDYNADVDINLQLPSSSLK